MSRFIQRLTRESMAWCERGLISSAQRSSILAIYEGEAGSRRFLTVLTIIGLALFTVGCFLVISANWHAIGDWVKLVGVVALLAGCHATGFWLAFLPGRYPRTGSVFFMLGCLLFLGGVALVTQIYHLEILPVRLTLIWLLGIAAIPWVVRSAGAQLVSLVVFLTWFVLALSTERHPLSLVSGTHFDEVDLVRVGAAIFLLGIFVLLSGFALRRGRFPYFAGIHETTGLILVQASLFFLSFARHLVPSGTVNSGIQPAPVIVIALMIVAVGFPGWRAAPESVRHLFPWVIPPLFPVLVFLLVPLSARTVELASAGAWIFLLLLDIGLVRAAMAEARERWVNLGIVFIALNLLARYFDYFWSMLQGGLFFVVTGALIIGIGIGLERRRRKLLQTMRRSA